MLTSPQQRPIIFQVVGHQNEKKNFFFLNQDNRHRLGSILFSLHLAVVALFYLLMIITKKQSHC